MSTATHASAPTCHSTTAASASRRERPSSSISPSTSPARRSAAAALPCRKNQHRQHTNQAAAGTFSTIGQCGGSERCVAQVLLLAVRRQSCCGGVTVCNAASSGSCIYTRSEQSTDPVMRCTGTPLPTAHKHRHSAPLLLPTPPPAAAAPCLPPAPA